jgi:ribosome-associated toxin RatA of RatAB toxin-antitoxin module
VNITENIIEIAAPAKTIYDLAAATERWPLILPHYRYVRLREDRGATRTVEMAAWRDVFPLRWVAEQTNDPLRPHIFFHHIEGPTRGMDVEWLFESVGTGTRVTIVHRLAFDFPLASAWLGEHVVGDYFISGVAYKTLARMKVLAEAAERGE